MTVSPRSHALPLAIALGDPAGIGPEVTLKALAAMAPADDQRYLLVGDAELLRSLNAQLGLHLDLRPAADTPPAHRFRIVSPPLTPAPPAELRTPHAAAAARAALAWLRHGADLCLRGEAAGLVTGPVNKESIIKSGEAGFVGQTELLSAQAGATRTAMMLLGCDDRQRWLRVVLATTHVPIARVAESLTRPKIELAIALATQACRDLGLPRRRIGVCGLNPHAGEGGQIGTEEITVIQPAVEALRRQGHEVAGPLAADTLFHYAFRGDYDAVVAMYHDQGLVPLKMIGFESGVNWTLGLPFIRTSPDHGTAYDIAGRGVANPSSLMAALQLARQLAR